MDDRSRRQTRTPIADFSIVEGGALYRLARACGIPSGASGLIRLGCLLAAITWLPLLALASIEGTLLNGPTIPFAQSIGTHLRFLLAVPLFFFAESVFGPRVSEAIQRIADAHVVRPSDLPRITATLRRTSRLWDSWVPEAALALFTGAAISAGIRADLRIDVSTWRELPGQGSTLAGLWYAFVSIPLFQFLFMRWCWRLLLWTQQLWHLSRLDLRLLPTHPDLAGGIGGLGVAHIDLSPLASGCTAPLAGTFAERIIFGGAMLESFSLLLVGTVVGLTLVLIAPLLLFTRQLLEIKQRGLLEYGAMASEYARAFDRKWLGEDKPDGTHMLGSPDLQSLADLGSSLDVIGRMRLVPISLRQIIMLALAAALPMVPLVLFVFPLDELIVRIIKGMVGI